MALWPLVDQPETVRHFVVMDDGDGDPDDPRVIDYEELIAAAPAVDFVRDEKQAASMCYTSGTTGNPKGVVYSHRSTYMHTITTMTTDGLGRVNLMSSFHGLMFQSTHGVCNSKAGRGNIGEPWS